MKNPRLCQTVAAVLVMALGASEAAADCQSSCVQEFPDACYNIKTHRWPKSDDGTTRVRFRNTSRFDKAFDWAVDELNAPHVGRRGKLVVKKVTSNPDVKIVDIQNLCLDGSCGFWGLARTKASGNRTTSAQIWLAVDELNENGAKADRLVREQTTIHEMLHTLGMNHACVNDNHTMWACGMPDKDYVNEPYMTDCDVDGLRALFGHGKMADPEPEPPPNLLKNGGFERKLEPQAGPWGDWARIEQDGDVPRRREGAAHAGDFGLVIEAEDQPEFVGVYQLALVEPGTTYRFDAWARHVSGNAKQCMVGIFLRWHNGGVQGLTFDRVEASPSSQFTKVGLDVKAPANAQAAAVFVGNCEAGTSRYAWDGIRVEAK